MACKKGWLFIATLAIWGLVISGAAGSTADGDRVTTHAITVDANGDDTASIPDFDRDGTIGFGDFVIFAGVFGTSQGDKKCDATYDLNGDGEIGFSDFVIFAQNFGKEAPSAAVSIPDANLRPAIEAALDKTSGVPITAAEMATLGSLIVRSQGIKDLTGLESATNLTYLDFPVNDVTDLSALSRLTKLTTLNLSNNQITDLSALAGLRSLRVLYLRSNEITDISVVSGLLNLAILDLCSNSIMDITALAGLNPVHLGLCINDITDVSALSGMTRLETLTLAHNDITDLSALTGLINLRELDLRGNLLSDSSIKDYIPVLESRGVTVSFDSSRKGDFDIELVFLDPFPEGRERVLRWAARRWTAVVSEDLPDYDFIQGWTGRCGDQRIEIPAGERIDDLRIYITSFEPEGNIRGWGGPTLLREESLLPVVGCMAFTRGKLFLPAAGPHEIGHVLGFGAIWHRFGFFQDPPDGDQHFNGPLAVAAFDDAGGRDYTGAKVPVSGGHHWRRSVIAEELMSSGGGPYLSAITVQSLADLGYGVSLRPTPIPCQAQG